MTTLTDAQKATFLKAQLEVCAPTVPTLHTAPPLSAASHSFHLLYQKVFFTHSNYPKQASTVPTPKPQQSSIFTNGKLCHFWKM